MEADLVPQAQHTALQVKEVLTKEVEVEVVLANNKGVDSVSLCIYNY